MLKFIQSFYYLGPKGEGPLQVTFKWVCLEAKRFKVHFSFFFCRPQQPRDFSLLCVVVTGTNTTGLSHCVRKEISPQPHTSEYSWRAAPCCHNIGADLQGVRDELSQNSPGCRAVKPGQLELLYAVIHQKMGFQQDQKEL